MKGEVQLQPPPVMQNPSDSDPLLLNQEEDDESPGSSGEIKDDEEDVEAGLLPCCRICLESDSDPEDELISPCMCKGTQQFVHRSCLDHWRSVKEGFAFSHCTTCKAQFHLRVELFEDNSWRKIKFRLFVARDVFLVFLAVQTVIAAIGGFAYIMDKDGSFRNSFDDGWDKILSRHPIPFYYCIGVLAFFVLIGFFGLILHCSSLNTNDPRMAGCQNCCYGWGILDCFPASMEACFALVVVFVVIFAILGIAYGFHKQTVEFLFFSFTSSTSLRFLVPNMPQLDRTVTRSNSRQPPARRLPPPRGLIKIRAVKTVVSSITAFASSLVPRPIANGESDGASQTSHTSPSTTPPLPSAYNSNTSSP